jgi:hypothetical protein
MIVVQRVLTVLVQLIPPNRDIPMSPRKKRSTSTPIPITMPQPIPGLGSRFIEEEEEEEEEYFMYPQEENEIADLDDASVSSFSLTVSYTNYSLFHLMKCWQDNTTALRLAQHTQ